MTDDKDTTDETPEEVTMKDLWRHISGLKGDVQKVESRLADKMSDGFVELKGETEAIRKVVDTLASHDDFVELDQKITVVAHDTTVLRQELHNTRGEVAEIKRDVKTVQAEQGKIKEAMRKGGIAI